MAQTRGPYELVDDTEVSAESPVTESLAFRLRDQWFAALADHASAAPASDRVAVPERLKTEELDVSKRLVPDGAGGVEWVSGAISTLLSTTGTANNNARLTSAELETGVWLVYGAHEVTVTGDFASFVAVTTGTCFLVNSSLVQQMATFGGVLSSAWSVGGTGAGRYVQLTGQNGTSPVRRIIAIRIA